MRQENYRVESTTIAHSSGNLTWGSWIHDTITALAMSGVKNPLGFAIVRYLSETAPRTNDIYAVVLGISGELIKRGVDTLDANETAWKAFQFWIDRRCPVCKGRGVMDFEQNTCKTCGGSGQRSSGSLPKTVSDAVDLLADAEDFMERQLRIRLKGLVYIEPDEGAKRLTLPSNGNRMELGNGASLALAIRPGHSY